MGEPKPNYIMESNIVDTINLIWENYGNKPAVVFQDRQYTYTELKQQSESLLQMLEGIEDHGENNTIALISKNNIFSIRLILACAQLGALCAPLNDELNFDQLLAQLNTIKPTLCFVESKHTYNLLQNSPINYDCHLLLISEIEESINHESLSSQIEPKIQSFWDKAFLLTTSSGSTGRPKPIVFSQQTKLKRAKSAISIWNLNRNSNIINASPFHHSLGKRHLFISLLSGATLIVMRRFEANDWLDLAIKYNANFAIPVTTHLKSLFTKKRFKDIVIDGQFTALVSSSAELCQDMRKLMFKSKTNFYEMYGASEIGTATVVKIDGNSPLNTVGKAIKDCQIHIKNIDPNSAQKIGEICVQSPYPFKEYIGIDSIPTTIINDDFFETGDLGWLDENKFLFFAGRKDDRINIGGISVYLNDISNAIKSLSYVIDITVVRISDDYFGMVPAVALVIDSQNKEI